MSRGHCSSDVAPVPVRCSQVKPLQESEMTIDIKEYDPQWNVVGGNSFAMRDCFFNPHDFAITDNYYVFFQNAMSFGMVSKALKASPLVCDSSRGDCSCTVSDWTWLADLAVLMAGSHCTKTCRAVQMLDKGLPLHRCQVLSPYCLFFVS